MRIAVLWLASLVVAPGRHTHERFSASGSVNIAGSVMVIV
jgi:hypothetical protein